LVLGPLIFNVCTNDLFSQINTFAEVINFADDTSILDSRDNYDELKNMLNFVLLHTFKQFWANYLRLNVTKTNIITFTHTKLENYPLTLVFSGQTLTELDNLKFLGLYIDSHLTWKSHIDFLLCKLSTACFVIRRLYKILSREADKLVYFAYFHSLIRYGIIF
jgi:hypothetical protein